MKKIVSFFLCIVLILTFSISAFAAESGGLICPTCGSAVIVHSDTIEGIYHNIEYVCSNKECDYKRKEKKILGMESVSGATATPIEGVTVPPSGYVDDSGTPNYNREGKLLLSVPCNGIFAGNFTTYSSTGSDRGWNISGGVWHPDVLELDVNHGNNISGYGVAGEVNFYIKAPVTGIYYVYKSDFISSGSVLYVVSDNSTEYKKENLRLDRIENRSKNTNQNIVNVSNGCLSLFCNAGDEFWVMSGNNYYSPFAHFSGKSCKVVVDPTTNHIENSTSITINNNTWNGNIYVDNSNKLTYIYPQYTINNETKISNNPIIYNQETKQYYTYDQTTNNYYYITYNAPTPTPTPSPSPDPGGSTPDPDKPSPTPTPGGSDSTDGGSGINPFKWLAELLKDIVEGIFKAVWKLTTSIFGFLIWLVGLLGNVLPFLPSEGLAVLSAAAIIITVLRIIKFILGR